MGSEGKSLDTNPELAEPPTTCSSWDVYCNLRLAIIRRMTCLPGLHQLFRGKQEDGQKTKGQGESYDMNMSPCQTLPKPHVSLALGILSALPSNSFLILPQHPRQKPQNTQRSNCCLLTYLHITSQHKKYLHCHPKGRIFIFCIYINYIIYIIIYIII